MQIHTLLSTCHCPSCCFPSHVEEIEEVSGVQGCCPSAPVPPESWTEEVATVSSAPGPGEVSTAHPGSGPGETTIMLPGPSPVGATAPLRLLKSSRGGGSSAYPEPLESDLGEATGRLEPSEPTQQGSSSPLPGLQSLSSLLPRPGRLCVRLLSQRGLLCPCFRLLAQNGQRHPCSRCLGHRMKLQLSYRLPTQEDHVIHTWPHSSHAT